MTANVKDEIKSVPGFPAKDFFVSMLTRDIELQDAILDLLDNCVDGAIRSRTKKMAEEDSLKGFWAHITLDEEKFVIEDNCGGIPWDIAHEYAFCMGRPEGIPTKPGTIGVVGIGMKRAIFKMGRECYVHSNHKDDTFMVTIPQKWFEDDKLWRFDADREKPQSRNLGTIVEIRGLTDAAQLSFKKGSTFNDRFPAIVGVAYSYLIDKGFTVKVNGDEVKRKPVKLCFEGGTALKKKGELIRPFFYRAKIDDVEVFMAVGYRSRLRTQEEQDEEKEATFAAKDAGWTVVCNDRVVLSNDQTAKTGWGIGDAPNFHNQFSCIAGIVEFRSPDTSHLPVTTTKRGIDTSKNVYTKVWVRMQEGLKCFTRNTNRWKGYESELKDRFDKLSYLDLSELKQAAKKLPFRTVQGDGVQRQYKPDLPVKKKLQTTRRIAFVKKISEIDSVSKYLFDETREPDEVGEACFDRVLKEAGQ
jgi:hypothetical protein